MPTVASPPRPRSAAKSAAKQPPAKSAKPSPDADPPKPRRRARQAEQKAAAAAAKAAPAAALPDAVGGGELRAISPALLDRSPHQRRPDPTPEDSPEFFASIARSGVLQPLMARPSDREPGRFTLVFGHRRRAAAVAAGLDAVPVIVRGMDDLDAAVLTWEENHKRSDLDPLTEAEQLDALREEYRQTHDAYPKNADLAKLAGLNSREEASNTLRLLKLPAEVQDLCREGVVSKTLARTLLKWADPPGLLAAVADRVRSVGPPAVAVAEEFVRVAAGGAEAVFPHPSAANGYFSPQATGALTDDDRKALLAAGAFDIGTWRGWQAFPEADGEAIAAAVDARLDRHRAESEEAAKEKPTAPRAAVASGPMPTKGAAKTDREPSADHLAEYLRGWRLRRVAAGLRASEGGDRHGRALGLTLFVLVRDRQCEFNRFVSEAMGETFEEPWDADRAAAAAFKFVAGGDEAVVDVLVAAVADLLDHVAGERWSDFEAAEAAELAERYGVIVGTHWGPDAEFAALYAGEPLLAVCQELGLSIEADDDQELRDRLCSADSPAKAVPIKLLKAAAGAEVMA